MGIDSHDWGPSGTLIRLSKLAKRLSKCHPQMRCGLCISVTYLIAISLYILIEEIPRILIKPSKQPKDLSRSHPKVIKRPNTSTIYPTVIRLVSKFMERNKTLKKP